MKVAQGIPITPVLNSATPAPPSPTSGENLPSSLKMKMYLIASAKPLRRKSAKPTSTTR